VSGSDPDIPTSIRHLTEIFERIKLKYKDKMNKDFNELIEYLDKKFEETAKKKDLEELTTKLVSFEEFAQFKEEVEQQFALLRESIPGSNHFSR